MDMEIFFTRCIKGGCVAVAYKSEVHWNLDQFDDVPPDVMRSLSGKVMTIIDDVVNDAVSKKGCTEWKSR